jgi:nucleotide-binding universal stress UspA family protein
MGEPPDVRQQLGAVVGDQPGADRPAGVRVAATIEHHPLAMPRHQQAGRAVARRIHRADAEKSQSQLMGTHGHPRTERGRRPSNSRRALGTAASPVKLHSTEMGPDQVSVSVNGIGVVGVAPPLFFRMSL